MVIHSMPVRFSANRPTVQYKNNLDVSTLESAIQLTTALNQQTPRIEAIDDRKDPLRMDITVGNGTMSAVIQNNNSPAQSLEKSTGTVREFVESLLQRAESLVPGLRSNEEIHQQQIQLAKDFLTPLSEAVLSGNYTIDKGTPSDYGFREGLISATFRLSTGSKQYDIFKVNRLGKYDYMINAVQSEASSNLADRPYEYLHYYRDGKLYDMVISPELHYRLNNPAAGQDIGLSHSAYVPDYGLEPLMEDVATIVQRLERMRQLKLPGDAGDIQV